jgi:APA family basic amino acid/polyamine antiporter
MTQVKLETRSLARASHDVLGLPQSTALIMGSIIGVGIFSLPYSLASYGPISLGSN